VTGGRINRSQLLEEALAAFVHDGGIPLVLDGGHVEGRLYGERFKTFHEGAE
jgi:hypothetical protein